MKEIGLKEEFIFPYIRTKWLGQHLVCMEEVDSTNTQAKKMSEHNAAHGTVIVTECQTAGRGRMGRDWISPVGNCYFSMILRPDILPEKASMITLVVAMAVVKAVESVTGLCTQIKWPNDVVYNGKKLCGILTESSTGINDVRDVIVGVGVNVNQKEFALEIQDMASSIAVETGKPVNRAQLMGELLNWFEIYYEKFMESGDLSTLLQGYNDLLVNCGKQVKIVENDTVRVMKAIGIDNRGRLLVEDEKGRCEAIISGEVSVRGLYGYI